MVILNLFKLVLNHLFGMRVNSHRRRRLFCMATAVTIALSLVIICLTSQALGQSEINEGDDNALGGSIASGRARIARLRRLRLRTEPTTTSAPVRERTRVRVKAIKSRKQKVNADRRATLAQSNTTPVSLSSSTDDITTSNRKQDNIDDRNNGRHFDNNDSS